MGSKSIQQLLQGNHLALTRLISQIENQPEDAQSIINAIKDKCGNALTIGITGPPGAGKSTLINQLTSHFRKQQKSVGVIAVDPTSPYSGGALLGDRIRMEEHHADPEVFIRSLGSRGSSGGLSKAAAHVVQLMDAFGMDVILIETVGVGQVELDVRTLADTIVLVLVPESGDGVQMLKAGIIEIADIFVVNKADRPQAHRFAKELNFVAEQYQKERVWEHPILLTQASKGEGIAELIAACQRHQEWVRANSKQT